MQTQPVTNTHASLYFVYILNLMVLLAWLLLTVMGVFSAKGVLWQVPQPKQNLAVMFRMILKISYMFIN